MTPCRVFVSVRNPSDHNPTSLLYDIEHDRYLLAVAIAPNLIAAALQQDWLLLVRHHIPLPATELQTEQVDPAILHQLLRPYWHRCRWLWLVQPSQQQAIVHGLPPQTIPLLPPEDDTKGIPQERWHAFLVSQQWIPVFVWDSFATERDLLQALRDAERDPYRAVALVAKQLHRKHLPEREIPLDEEYAP